MGMVMGGPLRKARSTASATSASVFATLKSRCTTLRAGLGSRRESAQIAASKPAAASSGGIRSGGMKLVRGLLAFVVTDGGGSVGGGDGDEGGETADRFKDQHGYIYLFSTRSTIDVITPRVPTLYERRQGSPGLSG